MLSTTKKNKKVCDHIHGLELLELLELLETKQNRADKLGCLKVYLTTFSEMIF